MPPGGKSKNSLGWRCDGYSLINQVQEAWGEFDWIRKYNPSGLTEFAVCTGNDLGEIYWLHFCREHELSSFKKPNSFNLSWEQVEVESLEGWAKVKFLFWLLSLESSAFTAKDSLCPHCCCSFPFSPKPTDTEGVGSLPLCLVHLRA